MEAGVHGHTVHVLRPVTGELRVEPDHATIQFQVMVEKTVLDLVLQPSNVIHRPVQRMEAGVHGHTVHVLRPVAEELREEPDHATIQFQVMGEKTVLDLVLQPSNVIYRPVQNL